MAAITKISTKDAPGQPIGHAVVDITGSMLPGDNVEIMIFRPDVKEFLARSGWQADQFWVQPIVLAADGGLLSIQLDPYVTAYLELGSNYVLHLRGNGCDQPLSKAMAWRGVAPLSRSQINNILGTPPAPKDDAEPAGDLGKNDPPAQEETTEIDTTAVNAPTVAPEPKASPRLGMMVALLAALVVAIGGGTAWYVLSHRAPAGDTVASTPAERLRQFLKTSPTPEQMVAQGETLRQQGAVAEAEFLFRAAADAGNSEGSRLLGVLFDPTALTPDRQSQSQTPSLTSAYSYYRKAIEGGNAAAKADLARLRVHVERETEMGNDEARGLLQVWRN